MANLKPGVTYPEANFYLRYDLNRRLNYLEVDYMQFFERHYFPKDLTGDALVEQVGEHVKRMFVKLQAEVKKREMSL